MPKPMLLAVALAVVLSGCVVAPNPIGDEPIKLKAEEWEGIWLDEDDEDGVLTIRVADAAKGELEVGWIEEDEDRLVLKSYLFQLRRTGGWVFANTKLEGEDHPNPESGEDWYYFLRIENEDGVQITAWQPDTDRFDALIEESALPGQVGSYYDNTYLGELEPEHMAMIMSTERPLFGCEEPLVLRRIRTE